MWGILYEHSCHNLTVKIYVRGPIFFSCLEFVSFSFGSKFVLGDLIFLCWLP